MGNEKSKFLRMWEGMGSGAWVGGLCLSLEERHLFSQNRRHEMSGIKMEAFPWLPPPRSGKYRVESPF